MHPEAFVPPRVAVHRRDDHALRKDLSHFVPAGNFHYPAGGKRRAAGDGANPRLAVQVALVTDAGVKRPGLRRRVAVVGAARRQIVVGEVTGLAVGGGIAPGHVHPGVHVFRGLAVVVVAGADLLLHHAVVALHLPDRLLTLRMLPGGRHRWQRQAFLVTLLAVVKLHHVDVQARVSGEAEPDAHLAQQAGNKVQVVLAVLHHLLTTRVLF
ncbi:hypothetical protein NB724_004062 [Pantoea ananatis]|nr:hypothetical protein [Pantoea ananatis]MCW0337136.1 hypothetical protein [Pantoea ananatis]MCW0385226.1 hypothetical protein [Pantoea ananatis]MCW0409868.1 hypothetical protein [Pantoea ananatis]MCW0430151.1 hypothetical protein [Pantoea ananatis]